MKRVVLFVCALWSFCAFAANPPIEKYIIGGFGPSSTRTEVCNLRAASVNLVGYVYQSGSDYWCFQGPNGTGANLGRITKAYYCPENPTVAVPESTQCAPPKCSGTKSVDIVIGYLPNPVVENCSSSLNCSPPASACSTDFCRFDVSGVSNVFATDTGSGFSSITATYTGTADGTECQRPSDPPPPVCPEGQAPGTVNGVSVCVPAGGDGGSGDGDGSGGDGDGSGTGGTGDGTGGTGDGSGTGGTGDGTGGTGDGSGDGSGTGTGSGTGSGTGTGTGGTGDGPGGEVDPGGTGTVGDGGSGSGSSGGSTGDAGGSTGGTDGSDSEEEGEKCPPGDQTLGCAKFGDVPGEDGIGRSTFNLSFMPENLLGTTGTCPADRTMQLNGKQIKMIDMQWACGVLSTYVKPIVILVALIAATFIVSGATGKID